MPRPLQRAARASALAALACAPAPATRAAHPDFVLTVGLQLDILWDIGRVGLGLDLKLTRLLWGDDIPCVSGQGGLGGIGIFGRGGLVFPDGVTFTLGGHVGREIDNGEAGVEDGGDAWDIEAGGTWRSAVGKDLGGRGPYLGAVYSVSSLELRVGGGVMVRSDGAVRAMVDSSVGLRLPRQFSGEDGTCSL